MAGKGQGKNCLFFKEERRPALFLNGVHFVLDVLLRGEKRFRILENFMQKKIHILCTMKTFHFVVSNLHICFAFFLFSLLIFAFGEKILAVIQNHSSSFYEL